MKKFLRILLALSSGLLALSSHLPAQVNIPANRITGLQAVIDGLDAYQPKDATLTALAGVTFNTAGQVAYATGTDTFTTAATSTFGRSLWDDADAATARTTLGVESIIINGLHGLSDKQTKISLNSPTGTLLTAIAFGDSLADRVAGHLLRGLQDQYSYGSVGAGLGLVTNPETSTGTFAGLVYTFSGGAAATGTDYTVWPTGGYMSCPNGSTVRVGNSSLTTFSRWAFYYVVEPGAGTFELETSPDASTWTSRGSFNAAGTKAGAVAAYSSTATAYCRIRVTSGTVRALGASGRRTANRGTLIGGISVGGLSIANAALTETSVIAPVLADLSPDMVTIHMDDNRDLMEANLPTVVGWFRTANPKCAIMLIGNGPKTGFEAEMADQNAYLRELAASSPGYAYVDSGQLLRSVAWLTSMGWIGDGTHHEDAAYAYVAERLINGLSSTGFNLSSRITRPFVRHEETPSIKTRQIAIGRNEDEDPALVIKTDASFGFDAKFLLRRFLPIRNGADAFTVFGLSVDDGVYASVGLARSYSDNMYLPLSSWAPYTTPTTGGVRYVEDNQFKWRNNATGEISVLSGVVDSNRGGAGSINGIMKANGSGTVSAAVAGTDYAKVPLTATTALDFGSIAAGASEDLTITVSGAVVGYSVTHGLPAAPTAGITWGSFVSAADTVTIRATNITASPVDPASATYRATVFVP